MNTSGNSQSNALESELAPQGDSRGDQLQRVSPDNSSAADPGRCAHYLDNQIPSPIPSTPDATAQPGPSFTYECPDLDEVIYLQRNLLQRLPTGTSEKSNSERAKWLASLGVLFQQRFERLGKPLDIGQAVNYHTQAVSHTRDAQLKHFRLSNLSTSLLKQYLCHQPTGDFANLERAISCQRNALGIMPEGHVQMPKQLSFLGDLLLHRFNHSKERPDLDKAIDCQHEALSTAQDGSKDTPALLIALSESLACRFDHNGEPEDLDRAIASMEKALTLVPDRDGQQVQCLKALGNLLRKRFEQQGSNADSNRADTIDMEVLFLTNPVSPQTMNWISEFGHSILQRFEQSGDLSDLQHAIWCQSRVLSLLPAEHIDRPRHLENIASSLRQRFQRLGELKDIDDAISYQEEAVTLTGQEHTSFPRLLDALGDSRRHRFERSGDLAAIDQAIEFQTQAFNQTPIGHADMPKRLDGLSSSLLQRYLWLGSNTDLNNAIEFQRQAIHLTPTDHARRPGWLNNLGNLLQRRFRHLGELGDIDDAIQCQKEAVSSTPDGHSDMPRRLDSLGSSLFQRYLWLGEDDDLSNAIEFQNKAIQLAPINHASLPNWLSNLGNSLQCRFEHSGHLEDIDQAIRCHSEAVSGTPIAHIDAPRRLDGLGNSYRHRFQRLGNAQDIDHATNNQIRAVRLTPQGHPEMPRLLMSLSDSYVCQFKHLGGSDIIDKAIDYQRQAVLLLPETHADFSRQLYHLGNAFLIRHEKLQQPNDIDRGIVALRQASVCLSGSPSVRFKSARAWAKAACLHHQESTLEAYAVAMSLLPRIIWLGSPLKHRQQSLSFASDIAIEAAAAAISFEKYDLSIEWLEEGSLILWKQVLQLRTPLDDLFLAHPELAGRLKSVAQELDQVSVDSQEPSYLDVLHVDQVSQKRRILVEEWENLVTAVRTLVGFDRFLQPKLADELVHAAHSSTIVILNVHPSRRDALIILPNSKTVECLPLPGFTYEQAVKMRSQLDKDSEGAMRGFFLRRPALVDTFASTMMELWTCAVRPILEYLGYLTQSIRPIEDLPHITWRSTGTLAAFPLHAAGDYNTPGSESKTYNYVISSYTPTLAALLAPLSSPYDFCGVLAVGQESSPDLPALPGTIKELQAISEHFADYPQTHLQGHSATCGAVLDAMQKHSWIHMACHASQNRESPMRSAFYLHDGSLDINLIAKHSLKHAGLAFLSACQTATGDEGLPEEAAHLASGMIVAGYPTVIATLWSIGDEHAPVVANRFYKEILAKGVPDVRRAAVALHKAMGYLRDRVGENNFPQWAAYIHIGI